MKVAERVAILIIAISMALIAVGCLEDAIIEGIVIPDPAPPINLEELLVWDNDRTDEESHRHWEAVVAAAVNVNLLDISGCTPNPLIVEVGYGESIEIKNSDTTDHTLRRVGSITIPAGGTRGIVVSDFTGIGEGVTGIGNYTCDGVMAGIFYVNPSLTIKPSERQRYVTFKVIEFLLPDERSIPGIGGVRVTCLDGSEEVRETATDGSVTFKRDLPLTVRLEKEGHITTEVTVLEEGEEIFLPSRQKNITFRVVEPLFPNSGYGSDWPDKRNGPGIGGVTVTCLEGSDEGTKVTDADGSVTFFGTPPLTIRIEKPGYITTEKVMFGEEEIAFPNEWPEEAEEAIRQLGLAERIASGELVLRWGDGEYLPLWAKEIGNDDIGGIYACPNIIIRKYEDRNFMLRVLIHEAMHAWQGLKSTNPPCDLHYGYPQSEEGRAWVAATEKDIQEVGPFPGIDGEEWARSPWENQAEFYSYWYMGPETKRLGEVWDRPEELKKLYRLAPNRCQYLEDRFGPPPPR